MIDTYSSFFDESLYKVPVVKPNLITGEGRMKLRRSSWLDKQPDLKKKVHRKMAKKSKRANRR